MGFNIRGRGIIMDYIKDIYSYFNDTNSSDKIFKTLKSKILDDFETYKMYKR